MNEGKLFILRHGEAEHNGKFFAGNRYDTELTERGRFDAEIVAEKLAELANCEVIYCSYLKRSRQTAAIVSQKILELNKKEVPVIELPGIEEADGGAFSGLSKQEIHEKFADEATIFYEDVVRHRNIKAIDFPEGENYEAVVDRLKVAIEAIREQLREGKHVAIITHGNTIRVLLDWLASDKNVKIETHTLEMNDLSSLPAEKMEKRGISEYHINVVSWEDSSNESLEPVPTETKMLAVAHGSAEIQVSNEDNATEDNEAREENRKYPFDAILVFGHTWGENGYKLSIEAKMRVIGAYQLWKDGIAPYIILTGG